MYVGHMLNNFIERIAYTCICSYIVFDSVLLFDMLLLLLPKLVLVCELTVLKGASALKFCICSLSLPCELHTQSAGDSKILFSRLAVSLPVSPAVCVSCKIARIKVGVTFI
jgi:hypothetical protein